MSINKKILTCSDPNCDRPSLPNSFKCELHEKRPTILKGSEELKRVKKNEKSLHNK